MKREWKVSPWMTYGFFTCRKCNKKRERRIGSTDICPAENYMGCEAYEKNSDDPLYLEAIGHEQAST